MIAINSQIIENILNDDKMTIDDFIAKKKTELLYFLDNSVKIVDLKVKGLFLTTDQINYVQYLVFFLDKIVRAKKVDLDKYKITFEGIISTQEMKSKGSKLFRAEIIRILGYEKLRDFYYPFYFEKIGIKSCVYCNSQLAITVMNIDNKKKAKFQVDHFFPKSEYPCFSISFYNLYPVCGSCNNSKSITPLKFSLYSDNYVDYKSSNFQFILDKKSLIKYRVNGNQNELLIKFNNSSFNEIFAIEGIYNTQKDIAEELVLKSMIYNKAYTESLKNSLLKLFKNKTPSIERLMLGNYMDEKDIHKRPMAKFTQDIAKQLKLI